MSERRNKLLADVMEVAAARLAEHVSPNAAEMIAGDLADHLADYWGGQLINFPKDFHWKLGKRELEIYDAYNGFNLGDLARKYDISERGLRKLIARVRERIAKATRSANQDMFHE
ncbi:Mor transcription activator family protein [Comamonas koreensis]|uniref:Mor transcription activator domain-containing protein n=1 Tax=Comamonas koreensis TaxID=160825 RepID=A0AAW4XUC4_9BURK|nr:Mor transcription activator family protein [Comamonas koreensis]MCD2164688.1 hypothetical protein [Comamonas koreensis]